jgi:carbon-monoxide dehydrogenase medium subunit
MKAAAFDHARAASVTEAIGLLTGNTGARVLAGGQSLGPMLNLRLAQPTLLVQVNRLSELCGVAADEQGVTIGACVTHAAIADGLVPDVGTNLLAGVAENIAYRAVRNRGTIGGSLCHADPAADWVTVLMALDAMVVLQGADGGHSMLLHDFIQGAFRTALAAAEIVVAVRIPRLADGASWGFAKACRKPGDFAHAMSAVQISREHRRIVVGALDGKPLLLEGDLASVDCAAHAMQTLDPVRRHMQLAVLRRALAMAEA